MADEKPLSADTDGDASASAENANPTAEKSGNKKILMILLPVLVLVNVLTVLYFLGVFDGLLGKKKDIKASEAHDTTSAAVAASHDEAKPEVKNDVGPLPVDVAYVDVPELMLNLNSKPPAASFLKIKLSLELSTAEEANKVKKLVPRLTDQYTIYLRQMRVDDLKGPDAMQRLKDELLTRTNAALSPIKVSNVLFETFLIQ